MVKNGDYETGSQEHASFVSLEEYTAKLEKIITRISGLCKEEQLKGNDTVYLNDIIAIFQEE